MARFVEFIGKWSDGESTDVLINVNTIAEVLADSENSNVTFIYLVGEQHKIAIYEPYHEVKSKILRACESTMAPQPQPT